MKKSMQLVLLVNTMLIALLSGCVPAPASLPTSTLLPMATSTNIGLKVASLDFTFQISEVLLDDTVNVLTTDGVSSHKDGLVLTPEGSVPVNATGDAALILCLRLESGDKQKFLEFEPKVIEGNVEKSPIEVITEDNGNGFFWIYDVNNSSRSFVLKLPNGTLDLQPTIALNASASVHP